MTSPSPSGPRPLFAIALAAGGLGAIQPKINAVLGERVGSAVLASFVNFIAAFAVVAVVLAVRPGTRRTLRDLWSWPVPRWTLTAGLGGAVVVMAGAVAVETIGVAIFSVAFFAGQITFGLLADRMGVGLGGVRPVGAAHVQAALRDRRRRRLTDRTTGRRVRAFARGLRGRRRCGICIPIRVQRTIAGVVGDAFAAVAVNVVVGLAALGATVAVLAATGRLGTLHWPTEPWLYTGGLLGVTIVLSLAIAAGALGVLRATLAMLAAQLVTAFVVDWAVQGEPPTPGVIVGAALIVVSVVLVGRRPGSTR